eukprot:m.188761 g.188761  ORF g.188761 m.188761 type:complete len:69 (-) comp15619_c0_seq11:1460-1666(-)
MTHGNSSGKSSGNSSTHDVFIMKMCSSIHKIKRRPFTLLNMNLTVNCHLQEIGTCKLQNITLNYNQWM